MKTSNTQQYAKALLKKYNDGLCTPEEQKKVLHWYYSFDGNDELVLKEGDDIRHLHRIQKNIMGHLAKESAGHRLIPTLSIKNWAAIAAILAIALSFTFLFYRYHGQPTIDTTMRYQELTTLPGERKVITLSDGSKIWLNNASTLKYPDVFTDSCRIVELEGEAFFEVAKQHGKPFIIHTPQLKVQVLGTSFNVKAFQNETAEAVTVATGKVAVSQPGSKEPLLLEKGDQAVYFKQNNSLTKSSADVGESRNWQNNILAFKYERMEQISLQLERWYGVKFVFKNKALLHKRYTIKQKNESLDNVLKVLSAGEFHYKITGTTITLW